MGEDMVKVSVVIPAYNVEKYIKTCLDSILEQTLTELEMIVINDGSTDKTKSIIETYVEKYPQIIKLVTKKNEGQGKARNIGIDLATGEFITFVDADDKIAPTMLEEMYDMAKKKQAEVIICDYYEITEKKKVLKKAIPRKTQDLKKDYIVSVAGPCNKLIQTKLLKSNKLYFLETGIYEDIAMIPLLGVYANKIAYLEESYYEYYIRQGSTMRQDIFNDKLLSIYLVLETLMKGFKESGTLEQYKEELEFIYIKHLLYAGTGRFLEYKEGRKEVYKIVQIMKEQYPDWKNNPYYKNEDNVFKLNCRIFYTNQLWLIVLFQKLKNCIKRGKTWKN